MKEIKTNTLYEKRGRKYVPVQARWYEEHNSENMPVGTFRLIYAYCDGARRYEYDVTPATAPAVAAMMIAKKAMEEAIVQAGKMRPNTRFEYTKRQRAAIARFREEMGVMFPSYWSDNMPNEIADAAIKAVLEFKP